MGGGSENESREGRTNADTQTTYPRQPARIENGSLQGLLEVARAEVAPCHLIHQLVRPFALVDVHQPVHEETDGLVSPQSHQALDAEVVQRRDRFADAAHPSSQLTGRVDVVRLVILRETLLNQIGGVERQLHNASKWNGCHSHLAPHVELHHGVSERLGETSHSRKSS